MRILEEYFSPYELANIRLEMKANESITIPVYSVQFIAQEFRKWMYDHFTNESTKDTKIVLYINRSIQINQRLTDLVDNAINNTGNHCVVVKRIKLWKHRINLDEELHEVKCFEIENFDGNEQTRYIPVDHPCFEEIQGKVNDIKNKYKGSDPRGSGLNKLGSDLAKTKYGKKLETEWLNNDCWRQNKKFDDKYTMLFFRCLQPCFQLKFNISS